MALAAVSVAVTRWQHGQVGMQETLPRDWELTWLILPRLAAAMLLAGLIQVLLLPRERVAGWLGARRAVASVAFAPLAGLAALMLQRI